MRAFKAIHNPLCFIYDTFPFLSSESVLLEVFPIIFAFKYLCHQIIFQNRLHELHYSCVMDQSYSIISALFYNQISIHLLYLQVGEFEWLKRIFEFCFFQVCWRFRIWHNYINRKVSVEFELFFFIRLYLTILFKLERIWMEFYKIETLSYNFPIISGQFHLNIHQYIYKGKMTSFSTQPKWCLMPNELKYQSQFVLRMSNNDLWFNFVWGNHRAIQKFSLLVHSYQFWVWAYLNINIFYQILWEFNIPFPRCQSLNFGKGHKIFRTCKRFPVWYILTILCPTK